MVIKNICCIGAGYVGGPTMAVIALKCPHIKVTLVDVNLDKIKAWNGPIEKLPVYEPGLSDIIEKTRGKNLFFSENISKAINDSEIIFMAVNTPTKTEGEGAGMASDLRYIEACANDIAKYARSNKIVVEKSTLPVRTAEKIKEILEVNKKGIYFEILSNPEFLAEGTAIQDLFKSDRVLIGGENTVSGQKALKALVNIYENWIPREKILTTNIWSSELAKLASNAMLAQRISSINSLSALCEKTGADIDDLSIAMGMDQRIGPHFLKASVGFGGSCFKKDILNLVYLCQFYGLNEVAEYWLQVVKINDYQKERFSQKIINQFGGNLKGEKIAMLGWAFKANTNDSRESASIYVANNLLKAGSKLTIYDPMVGQNQIFEDIQTFLELKGLDHQKIENIIKKVKVFNNINDAVKAVSAIAILTEWDEFQRYNWDILPQACRIYDGRNFIKFNNNKITHL